MKLGRRLAVEGAGNAWLMFAGRAAKALNTSPPSQGLHVFGMAAAFGLALTVANYAAARAASGRRGFSVAASDFGSNGYGDHLPADYALAAVYLMELTAPPLLGEPRLAWCTASLAGARAFAPRHLATVFEIQPAVRR